MNIIHPLPPHLYTIEEHLKENPPQPYYDDPPPPYESPLPSIKVEFLSEYSLNVKINDNNNRIIIRIFDNQTNIQYEEIIHKESEFWKQNNIIFQNNYENFLKIMKLKFIDNINLFNYSFELIENEIHFRIIYESFINGFNISFIIKEKKDEFELFNEIESLKKQLKEKNNELLVNNFIIEENI